MYSCQPSLKGNLTRGSALPQRVELKERNKKSVASSYLCELCQVCMHSQGFRAEPYRLVLASAPPARLQPARSDQYKNRPTHGKSVNISTPGCTRNLDARVLICMSIRSHATSAAVLVLFNTCFECYWARRLSSVKSDMFHLSKKTTTASLQRDKKTART